MAKTDKNKLQEGRPFDVAQGRQELKKAQQAYDKNRCKKTLAAKRRAGEICNALELGLPAPDDRGRKTED